MMAILLIFFISLSVIASPLFSHGSQVGQQDCVFMEHGYSICHMNPIDHIGAWQEMFTALPAQMGILLALLMIVVAIVYLRHILTSSGVPPESVGRLYVRAHPESKLFDFLITFFSRGILHPRLYS